MYTPSCLQLNSGKVNKIAGDFIQKGDPKLGPHPLTFFGISMASTCFSTEANNALNFSNPIRVVSKV